MKSGLIHSAIQASRPECFINVTANEMGIINFSNQLVLAQAMGIASCRQSKNVVKPLPIILAMTIMIENGRKDAKNYRYTKTFFPFIYYGLQAS